MIAATPPFSLGYCHAGTVRGTFLASVVQLLRAPIAAQCADVIHASGAYIHVNRNNIVQRFLLGPVDWLLFVDVDMQFRPQDVAMLLAHARDGKRVLAGLYDTMICGERMPCWFASTNPPTPITSTASHPVALASCGMGFTAIHRAVFEMLGGQWFDHALMRTLGGTYSMPEDMSFCDRATTRGFPVWGIPTVRLGHDKTQIIYPESERADG